MSKQINLSSAVGGGSVGFAHNNPTEDHTITLPNETIAMPMMRLLTSQDTTSGTFKEFTIPSWAKKITIVFKGVSTNGTSKLRVRIGSGTVETSGYVGSSLGSNTSVVANATFTDGFDFNDGASIGSTRSGKLELLNMGSNIWSANGMIGQTDQARMAFIAGDKTISGILNKVSFTTANGTDIFDNGTVNILVEGY